MITQKERPYQMSRLSYSFIATSTLEKSLKAGLQNSLSYLSKKEKSTEKAVPQKEFQSMLSEQEYAATWGWTEKIADALILKDEETNEQLAMQEVNLSVSLSKSIVCTSMVAFDGTIKELISNGDYAIKISGAIVSTDRDAYGNESNVFSGSDQYPEEGVRALLRMCTAQRNLLATSDFLQLFNINCIVIQNLELPQAIGGSSRQEFLISAVSDIPYTIKREEV